MNSAGRNQAGSRVKQLAKIHVIALKRLKMDRDTYVALLQRVAGVSSSADLNARGRHLLIQELNRLTGMVANAVPLVDAPQNVRDEIAGMVGKIGAILGEIDKPWGYAHGTARRMFKVHRVEWLRPDQLHRLVAALQISANRRK